MGRHRRSAPLTADEAASIARKARAPRTRERPAPLGPDEDPSEATTQPIPVIPADGDGSAGRHRSARRPGRAKGIKARGGAPAARRAGLLGASAAVAMGAAAMISGLLPGGGLATQDTGGTSAAGTPGQVRADQPQPGTPSQRSRPAAPGGGREEHRAQARPVVEQERQPVPDRGTAEDARAGRGAERGRGPDSPMAAAAPGQQDPHAGTVHTAASVHTATDAGVASAGAGAAVEDSAHLHGRLADPHTAAAHLVLSLVNEERARAGCKPLRADSRLNGLAQSFSDDMARRDFFDHTDPDGRTPWDRAARRGVKNLGGENIARGHPDAHAVMNAWMQSAGHRQNILNCEYKRLGVGVHMGDGGPWWTQDFGY
ncbi:CAP domain-containing protein [Streptomyces morookaense]|uniref:CAP domain-containing protein n=1 Tax=Streptomyces morookaense TaxID=1970 RepID=A0A7Y7BAQ9_STRMO|nr:CAP domain-containing protein [Streptomyces morookaense]NVK82130.1 CAP domain-containing protein [Streptomyces morookaense]GHF12181.1 hypothetical protein GCM10010359_11640 [Streptomyces morookaense]